MGEYLFYYPKQQIAGALAKRGFVTIRGRKPVKTTIRIDEISETRNLLVVVTKTDESGSFYIPCADPHNGFFYASTEPLPSGRRRLSLFLELCRGQLSRIQKKRTDWSFAGFSTPNNLRQQIRRATQKFSVLVTSDQDAADFDANTLSLFTELCEIGGKLNELYLSQTLAARRRVSTWNTQFGFAIDSADDWTTSYDALFTGSRAKFDPVFQTVNIRTNWRDIDKNGTYDWSRVERAVRNARNRGLRVTLGPLTRWGSDLPSRLQRPSIPAETLRIEYEQYLNSAFDAVGNHVDRWIVATNVETSPSLPTFEFRLPLAMKSVATIHARFPHARVLLGFEQALGDVARFADPPLVYPIELAARLAARHMFDGYYLEVNFGLTSHTTAPRDPMELHRFFDRWSMCGVKLSVATSCPSASPFAASNALAPSELFDRAFGEKPKRSFFFRSSHEVKPLEELLWNVQVQQELARRFYSSALARKAVDELIWSRWLDASPMNYEEYTSATKVFDPNHNDVADSAEPQPEDETYDDVESVEYEEEFPAMRDEDDEFDEIDLVSDDSCPGSESVSYSSNASNPENFTPTSGLIGLDRRVKPTLYKLAALKRAYLND